MRALNLTLLTDLYELTMMQGYFKNPTDQIVVFDAFYRKNPCDGGYAIAAGLDQIIEYVRDLHFSPDDIDYLRSLNIFDNDFLEYLRGFHFTGDIYAIPEGTVVFPREPLMKVIAPVMEAQLVETAILNMLNHQSLIATKASRVVYAAKGDGVMEFGLRRAQGPDAGIYGARAAMIGGCIGTSNVLTGQMFDVPVKGTHAHSAQPWQEKADHLRLYSGARFSLVEEVPAGCVCAVAGLSCTWAGEGLGMQADAPAAVLEPVLCYRVLALEKVDAHTILSKLRILQEEEPGLRVSWNEARSEILVHLMGEVQLEIVTRLFFDRFGISLSFDEGTIAYKETISDTVEGIGHFEPLRHYAEVRLLLSPGEPGSGIRFANLCPEDTLARNWQNLIFTHLSEKEHIGVLTGSPVTDIVFTLVSGKSHLKHTEGGDFRQATYRAVRHGLMQAQSV